MTHILGGSDMSQIDAAQVAVLAERVDNMLRSYDELRGLILAQNNTLSQFGVLQSTVTEQERKLDRAFSAIRENTKLIGALERAGGQHSWAWKLLSVCLLACGGFIGWGWNQIQHYNNADVALDRRILLVEYKLGLPQPTKDGEK